VLGGRGVRLQCSDTFLDVVAILGGRGRRSFGIESDAWLTSRRAYV